MNDATISHSYESNDATMSHSYESNDATISSHDIGFV